METSCCELSEKKSAAEQAADAVDQVLRDAHGIRSLTVTVEIRVQIDDRESVETATIEVESYE